MHRALLVVVLELIAACSKGSINGTACPPLQVSVDGRPVAAPTYGLAWVGSGSDVAVEMFNHDGVACDELYLRRDGGRRDIPVDEVSVGAWARDKEPRPTGVSFSSNTNLHTERTVAGKLPVEIIALPDHANDRIALCVHEAVTIPLGPTQPNGVAPYPEAQIIGTIEGRYCPPPH